MTYEEIKSLLGTITSIDQLKALFKTSMLAIHIEISTFSRAQRFDLISQLLALNPFIQNEEGLKKQCNDLFQQLIIAPYITTTRQQDYYKGDMPLFITSLPLQASLRELLPKEVQKIFYELLAALKKPYAYLLSNDQLVEVRLNTDSDQLFFSGIFPCVNAIYPLKQLQKDLTPENVILSEQQPIICIRPQVINDAEALKRITACTNTDLLKDDKRMHDRSPQYFTLTNSEKPWEELQLNFQPQLDSLTAWYFIHHLQQAGLLKFDNFNQIADWVKSWAWSAESRQINWTGIHYAIEVLAKEGVLSQPWFDILEPMKENIDWLYYQLKQRPGVKPTVIQDEYFDFHQYDRHRKVLIVLFLRVFNNPTKEEFEIIKNFCKKVPDRCNSGEKACLALHNLLRRGLIDIENCNKLLELDTKTALSLLCDDLYFLQKTPNINLNKKRFTAFLDMKFPGPRFAASCKLIKWGLSEACQTIIIQHHSEIFLSSIGYDCPTLTEAQFLALERCTTLIKERAEALLTLFKNNLFNDQNIAPIFHENASAEWLQSLRAYYQSNPLTQGIFTASLTFSSLHSQRLNALRLLNKLGLLNTDIQNKIINTGSIGFLKAIDTLDKLLTQPLLNALFECSTYHAERALALRAIYTNRRFKLEQRDNNTKILLEIASQDFLKMVESFVWSNSIVYSQATFDDLLAHPTYPQLRLKALNILDEIKLLTTHRHAILNDQLSQDTLSAIATLHHNGGSKIPITSTRLEHLLAHPKPQLFLNILKEIPAALLTEDNINVIETHEHLESLYYFCRNKSVAITQIYLNNLLNHAPLLGSQAVQNAYQRIPESQRTAAFYERLFQECSRVQRQPIEVAQAAIIAFLQPQLRPARAERVVAFAERQSTHQETIHASASESARKLKQTYAHSITTPTQINTILNDIEVAHTRLCQFLSDWRKVEVNSRNQAYLETLLASENLANWPYATLMQTPEDVNELLKSFRVTTHNGRPASFLKNEPATRAISKIAKEVYGEHLDNASAVNLRTLLALAWLGIHDVKKSIDPLVSAENLSQVNTEQRITRLKNCLKNARVAFINGLYDLARDGKIGQDGVDDGDQQNCFACPPGAFNKLIESLVGIHSDAKQTYVTPKSIAIKYQKIVLEHIQIHLMNRMHSITTKEEADALAKYLNHLELKGIEQDFWAVIQPIVLEKLWNAFMVGTSEEAVIMFTRCYPNGKTDSKFQDLVSVGHHVDLSDVIKSIQTKLIEKRGLLINPPANNIAPGQEHGAQAIAVRPSPLIPQAIINNTAATDSKALANASNQIKPKEHTKELRMVLALLTSQIKDLRWNLFALFFRSYQEKRVVLASLKETLQQQGHLASGHTIHDILLQWKTEDVSRVLKTHRNRFFISERAGVKTNTESLIEQIDKQYGHCRVN